VKKKVLDLPQNEELEITLIGSGGGYGESVVIHVGNNEWMIIDSCKGPDSPEPLPLGYLKSIGVNAATQVKRILCTHWDDDHIQGMSQIVGQCSSAQFIISKVTDIQKFLKLVALDYQKLEKGGSISATKEFVESLDTIRKRGTKPAVIYAIQDRNLWTYTGSTFKTEVFSLSPSDESVNQFDIEVSNLITEFGVPQKRLVVNQNKRAVVLFVKFGDHRIMLGSDLEVTASPQMGWLGIINLSQIFDKPASYFKIPHHGSENGYHDKIWNVLLTNKPIGTLTPWNRNKKLPQPDMVLKYKALTRKMFISSPPVFTAKPKRRDPDIEKLLRTFDYDVREVKYIQGIIRARIKMTETEWTVDLFDAAIEL
jgi:beta-lactamase superfamily II metal-dependent hydrolase